MCFSNLIKILPTHKSSQNIKNLHSFHKTININVNLNLQLTYLTIQFRCQYPLYLFDQYSTYSPIT